MYETKNKPGLDNSLNLSQHQYSFEASSLFQAKALPNEQPQILPDLETELKEPIPHNQPQAQDILHLDDIMKEYNKEPTSSHQPEVQKSSQKMPKKDLDLHEKIQEKKVTVNLNNNDKYKQRIKQREEAIEVYNNSDLLGSSRLSSYIQDNSPDFTTKSRTFDLQAVSYLRVNVV